jgi:serine/threonine protein kinase
MRICLNPDHPHPGVEPTPTRLACAEPMCGFLLAGAIIQHWQVISLFARGSIADLYMAVNMDGSPSGPSKVVVKVLRAPTVEPASQLEQKLAQLLSLRHQYINPLMSAGWTASPGLPYFLAPFAEQGSLVHYPITSTPLSPRAVAGIVRQIAEALDYAHEDQIVHGRLKLENCLVPAPGIVQVSDFFYFLLSEAERYASPSTVAPEQFYGQAEAASDQYTLALLAYQLLVGQLPFAESGLRARLALQEQPLMRPVTQFRRDVSARVDRTLDRALSRQPQDRFPNITAFALDFQAALDTDANGAGVAFSRVVTPTPLPSAVDVEGPQSTLALLRYSSPGRVLPICTLPGHTSAATLLRWAPDGIHLASASDDQSIRLWSVQHRVGTPLITLTGHSDNVRALSWSPDSSALVSGGADATVRTWLLGQSTVQTAWWAHDGSVAVVDWSPTGTYIASGGPDRTIRIWDRLGNPVSVWQAHGRGGVTALAWSPDGRTLASGGTDHLIHLWDTTNGTILVTLDGHTDEIRYLVWSQNGTLLASYAGKKDLRIGLWDRQTDELVAMLSGHTREIVGLFWSSDGAWLATASADATLRYWDTHRHVGEPIGWPVKLENSPLSMVGSPESGMIAVSLADMLIQVLQLQIINWPSSH